MQAQIYDARLCTNNQEKNSQTKNELPKQLVRSVGCRYGVQRVLLNLAIVSLNNDFFINRSFPWLYSVRPIVTMSVRRVASWKMLSIEYIFLVRVRWEVKQNSPTLRTN